MRDLVQARLGNSLDFDSTQGPTQHIFGQKGNSFRLLTVNAPELWRGVEMPPSGSWVITLRATALTLPSLVNTIPIIPLEAVIVPSSGGAQSEILCDVNSSVVVHSPSFSASIRWQAVEQNTTAGVNPFVVPPQVRVEALANLTTAFGNAHHSQIFPANTLPGNRFFFFDVPPLAQRFGIRASDSSLLWLASSRIGFVSGFSGVGIPLGSWSGSAFLTEMKTRGFVPVPARSASGFVSIGGAKTALDHPWVTDFELGF